MAVPREFTPARVLAGVVRPPDGRPDKVGVARPPERIATTESGSDIGREAPGRPAGVAVRVGRRAGAVGGKNADGHLTETVVPGRP